MSGNIGFTFTQKPQDDLEYALNNLCDMIGAANIAEKTKSNIGLTITSLICDAAGNTLFSYDTVMTYSKDADGSEHIRAEFLGKVVESLVFDAGIKQTIKTTLAATAATAIDSSPIAAVGVGVMVFSTGYSLSKLASVTAGEWTAKLIKAYNIEDKHIGIEGAAEVFSKEDKTAEITTDLQTQKNLIPAIKNTSVEKIQIGSNLYDITSDNNTLLVRNALDKIPSVSILLSHIDIDVDDKIDLGVKGIYTVSSGNTFSEIANNNGFSTKELLQLNTWLIDEGKVHFDQDKVLVDVNASDLGKVDHTLTGEANAANVLIDLNGGNDVLVGGSEADILQGGADFDTYIANNQDVIMDSDGKGKVLFDSIDLTGRKKKNAQSGLYEDSDYSYTDSNGTLTVKEETYPKCCVQQ